MSWMLYLQISLLTAQRPNELEVRLNAALLDYYDDLASWVICDQAPDAERIVPGDRLLYMYMDRSTTEWCMWKRCLVWNSSNFAAIVTSLPPYLTKVTSVEVCAKLNSLGDGGSAIRYLEPAWNDYFVVLLPSKYFERTGELSVLIVDDNPLAFNVFTRQRQPNDPDGNYFKYEEVVCAGKSLFSTTM